MASSMHADQVITAVESGSQAARSMVAASWARSMIQHNLQPDARRDYHCLGQTEYLQSRERHGKLLDVAQPTIDYLFNAVGNAGCCVVLCDQDGVMLEQRSTAADLRVFGEWGLSEGAVWDEASQGTNGVGTCIEEQRPVTIHRKQHFFTHNTEMSCIDAPVFDHEGKLVAALDVTSCRADDTTGWLSLIGAIVVDAARRIETDYFRAAYPDARIIMGEQHGRNGAVLLAVDHDDLVVGATRAARQAFNLKGDLSDIPRPAADLLCGDTAPTGFEAAERSELQRALARSNGNVSEAARILGIGRATIYRRMKRLGMD